MEKVHGKEFDKKIAYLWGLAAVPTRIQSAKIKLGPRFVSIQTDAQIGSPDTLHTIGVWICSTNVAFFVFHPAWLVRPEKARSSPDFFSPWTKINEAFALF